ncbi:MAG: hypothetical protein JWO32_2974, partial [Bacteroidetes bacterium]|nr:hypothetical protein [Bacteroidota bacterium]
MKKSILLLAYIILSSSALFAQFEIDSAGVQGVINAGIPVITV